MRSSTLSKIHVISENELDGVKKVGRRIRARCPIHGSRDRDLSLAPWYPEMDEDEAQLAGYGHCHSANCGATVLVKEWNPQAASRLLHQEICTSTPPRITMTTEEREEAEAWQRDELALLTTLYPTMQVRLDHERAQAYLAERGITENVLDLAVTLGVGYIPPALEWVKQPPGSVKKWCDRIIFPFITSEGERGFLGRSLRFWHPGMDENEHKQLLSTYNEQLETEHGKDASQYQVKRWVKTYRSGFFNGAEMSQHEHLYICEGPFDALPLIYTGVPGVVAVAGTHIDVKALPKTVFSVTLAFDADMKKAAIARLNELLAHNGITPTVCAPPADDMGKDWSERYRRHGERGLAPVLALAQGPAQNTPVSVPSEIDYVDMLIAAFAPLAEKYQLGDTCCVCQGEVDRLVEVAPEVIQSYCELCYQQREQRIMRQRECRTPDEQCMQMIEHIASVFPNGCAVTIDEPGYTIDARIAELRVIEQTQVQERTGEKPVLDYWERVYQELARQGYYERFHRDAVLGLELARTCH